MCIFTRPISSPSGYMAIGRITRTSLPLNLVPVGVGRYMPIRNITRISLPLKSVAVGCVYFTRVISSPSGRTLHAHREYYANQPATEIGSGGCVYLTRPISTPSGRTLHAYREYYANQPATEIGSGWMCIFNSTDLVPVG